MAEQFPCIKSFLRTLKGYPDGAIAAAAIAATARIEALEAALRPFAEDHQRWLDDETYDGKALTIAVFGQAILALQPRSTCLSVCSPDCMCNARIAREALASSSPGEGPSQ